MNNEPSSSDNESELRDVDESAEKTRRDADPQGSGSEPESAEGAESKDSAFREKPTGAVESAGAYPVGGGDLEKDASEIGGSEADLDRPGAQPAELDTESLIEAASESSEEEPSAKGASAEESGVSGDEEDEEMDDDSGAIEETPEPEEAAPNWYILKVQVNREDSIKDALLRRIKLEGLEDHFLDIIVPTEDVAEFTKTGKRRIVKRKLYPGYIMVNMVVNDDTWFLVRETPGIGDFTGSAGKPTPMDPRDVERILNLGRPEEERETQIRTAIPFKSGDRVRVKEGYFQNFEGDVETIDEANGRVTVMINIFGRSTPVELEHWQIESV